MAEQVRRADSMEGDIDTLSQRIAQIRTWTFVSNRPGWLADQAHWREKTRDIEDRLSDALHERLTKRFVDRRTSVLMRRLRENSMPEAEISPTGAVLVEGHHVGELQGFRFTADQSAGGEDAKAVRAAAQKALAAEFETRADRFGICANGDLALASDGIIRWIGAPIGTLTASDDALRPRVILLADEQLTGPAREKVAARAERFVNFQIDSLLKPLIDLKNATQIAGIGKGIAFQLAENFGLLNRRDIADDVKALDQEGRAALRRLGVRFGAYHVFVPTLVKPGPAGLITLLWSLKNDGKDKPGFGDVVHALAAGRTSVVVDQTYERAFYKLAGFRVLGRRAVRIDILERLADLIRPALAWRAGTGTRPDGALDGSSFVVTPPMMSILGANADDMEEILKGLGYRGEPRPAAEVKSKLEALDRAAREAADTARAKAAADALAATAASAETAGNAIPAGNTEGDIEATEPQAEGDQPAPTEPASEFAPESQQAEAAPEAPADTGSETEAVAASEEAPVAEDGTAEAPTTLSDDAPADETPAVDGQPSADPTVARTSDTQPAEAAATDAAPAEEPKPILVWRQGRFDQRPRQRHDARPGGNRERQAPGNRSDGHRGPRQPRDGAEAGDGSRHARPDGRPGGKQRFDRKFGGKPGEGGPDRREGRGEGGDGNKPRQGFKGKPAFQQKPREERPARFDPDSPFAKLAALRDQLKK